MDITLAPLAATALRYASSVYGHGFEVMPGFFNVQNEDTGQSRTVVLHEESDTIFKTSYGLDGVFSASGAYIGEVTIDGTVYPVRLPMQMYFDDLGIEAQEYVRGENHNCNNNFGCEHSRAIAQSTGAFDTHTGNWKIANGEVVLFDH